MFRFGFGISGKPVLRGIAGVLFLMLAAGGNAETIVTGDNYPPWTSLSLPEGGYLTAVVRVVYAQMGHPDVDITFHPWTRGFEETKRGAFGMTFPYAWNAEREQQFWYSDILAPDHSALISSISAPITDVAGLRGKRLCLPVGYTTHVAEILSEQAPFTLERPPEMPNCLGMLSLGRVDAVLSTELVLRNLINMSDTFREADFAWLILDQPELRMDLYALFPKADPAAKDRRDRFNAALRSLSESGKLSDLKQRYFGNSPGG